MARHVQLDAPVASALPALQRLNVSEEHELPVMLEASRITVASVERSMDVLPTAGGGEETARPDGDRAGRGGDREVTQLARFLAQRDDGITLDTDTMSHLDRSQVARIRVANDRASLDDRRALSEPMELTFVAVGLGQAHERRVYEDARTTRGSADSRAASQEGATKGAPLIAEGVGEKRRETGTDRAGGPVSPGAGTLTAKSTQEHRASADTATVMPEASTGRDATLADTKGATRDNKSSEQDVATRDPALQHASTAGGELGAGKGGEAGGNAPGAGGISGSGSQSQGAGRGGGPVLDPADDPRRIDYIRRLRARLFPLWANAFPVWAALEGRGGHTIYTVTIAADGRLLAAALARPSRIAEFDENIRKAIGRAFPFEPLPAALGLSQLTVTLSFDAVNPAVR